MRGSAQTATVDSRDEWTSFADKKGMVYDDLGQYEWDQRDPRNRGVLTDRRVMTQEGIQLRIVSYLDPASGEFFEFLTNEPDLPVTDLIGVVFWTKLVTDLIGVVFWTKLSP